MCFLHSFLMHSATEINTTDQLNHDKLLLSDLQFHSDSAAVWFMNSSGEHNINTAGVSGSGHLGYQGQVKSSPSRL